jgi:hypothetical protein
MQLATPKRPSDQVAALTGITPAATDPGQPTRLALRRADTRQAEAAPVLPPQPQPQFAEAAPAPQPQFAEAAPAPVAPPPAPVVAEAPRPAPVMTVAQAAAASPEAPAAFAAFAPRVAAPAPIVRKAAIRAPVRNIAFRRAVGKSSAVVQLGAYGSPQRVAAAWSVAARRYGVLKAYSPMSARFDSSKGTVYRLSVKGFASDRDARLVCESLRRSGGSCFVRNVAGDAPVQFASR